MQIYSSSGSEERPPWGGGGEERVKAGRMINRKRVIEGKKKRMNESRMKKKQEWDRESEAVIQDFWPVRSCLCM